MNHKDADLLGLFACPQSREPLAWRGDEVVSAGGRRYPVVRGVPRFVPGDAYVGSFSFEWNVHAATQLDCATGRTDAADMLRRKTGLTPEQVRGKRVLDAGVGAGRFCDVLSRWGAKVVGIDLSFAVEASSRTFEDRPNVVIVQADIAKPPLLPEAFDYVVSIGVLHHTSDPRRHFEALLDVLAPGGEICVWVYPEEHDYLVRKQWIPFTSRIPPRMFHAWCRWFVPWIQRRKHTPLGCALRRVFPYSDQGMGLENDVLDTFDGYSPRYHWTHSPEQVEQWFRENGLDDVHCPGDWHTSVRGRKPAARGAGS